MPPYRGGPSGNGTNRPTKVKPKKTAVAVLRHVSHAPKPASVPARSQDRPPQQVVRQRAVKQAAKPAQRVLKAKQQRAVHDEPKAIKGARKAAAVGPILQRQQRETSAYLHRGREPDTNIRIADFKGAKAKGEVKTPRVSLYVGAHAKGKAKFPARPPGSPYYGGLVGPPKTHAPDPSKVSHLIDLPKVAKTAARIVLAPKPSRGSGGYDIAGTHFPAASGQHGPFAVRALDLAGRPLNAGFGAYDAVLRGKNVPRAVVRGIEGKDHKTGSDIVGDIGIHDKVLKAGLGLGLDALAAGGSPRFALEEVAPKVAAEAADKAAVKATEHLSQAAKATARGDTKAAAKSVAKGQKQIKRLDAIKADQANPTRGVRVAVRVHVPLKEKPLVHVKTSGRTSAAVGRKVKKVPGVKAAGARARTGLNRTVSPATTPEFRTRAEHRVIRVAQQKQRGAQAVAEHNAERHMTSFVKAVPKSSEREMIGHAIETDTIDKLPKRLQAIARTHKRVAGEAVYAAKHRAGLLDEPYKPQGPKDPPVYIAHVNKKDLEKGGHHQSGGARPGQEKRRQMEGTIRDKNAVAPGLFVEDPAVGGAVSSIKAAHNVSKAEMWAEISKKTGRDFTPDVHMGRFDRVYEITPRGPKPIEEYGGYRDLRAEAKILNETHPAGKYKVFDKRSIQAIERQSQGPSTNLYDKITGSVKHAMTVNPFNPGFQLRNFTGDTTLGWQADTSARSFKQANQIRRAVKLRRKYETSPDAAAGATSPLKIKADQAANKTIRINGRDEKVGNLIDQMQAGGATGAGQYGSEVRNQIGGARVKVNRVIHRGQVKIKDQGRLARFNQAREDLPRTATFLSGKKQGMTAEDASAHSLQSHIDYGDKTLFERNVAQRVFPFYTFFARNSAIQAKNLVKTPAKIMLLSAAFDEVAKAAGYKSYMQYVHKLPNQQQRGMPIPVRIGKGTYPVYLSPPQTDLNQLTVNPAEQTQNLVNRLTFFKSLYELPANYSFFFQGPIRDPKNPLVPAPLGVEKFPKFMRDMLGVAQYVDKKSGKKIWGWDARVDYASRLLPQSNVAISAAKPVPDARGLTGALRIGSYLTGIKVGPDDTKSGKNQINALYTRRIDLDNQLGALHQRLGMDSQRHYKQTHETRTIQKQIAAIDKKIGHLKLTHGVPRSQIPRNQLPSSGNPFSDLTKGQGKNPFDQLDKTQGTNPFNELDK